MSDFIPPRRPHAFAPTGQSPVDPAAASLPITSVPHRPPDEPHRVATPTPKSPDQYPEKTTVHPETLAHQSPDTPHKPATWTPDASQNLPDENPSQASNEVEKHDPVRLACIHDVPDGWIPANAALERINAAGLGLDGRRVRLLCSRNELENIKVKNEKNQPQYFINPNSIDRLIAEKLHEKRPVGVPVQNTKQPDQIRQTQQDNVVKPDQATSGQKAEIPEGQGSDEMLRVQLAVAEEKLRGKDTLINELRDEKQHLRSELAKANELREHVLTLAQGTENISKEMLETLRSVANRSLPTQSDKPPIHYTQESGFREGV